MSYFIIKGKAIYVQSKLDEQVYCKTNGKFDAHLTANNLTIEDYVERYIDGNSLCPHCKLRRMRLDRPTWKWTGCCGASCRSAAIKKAKAESFSDPARRQLFIERLKASQTVEQLQKATAASMVQMTPQALLIAKEKRRATCKSKYDDSTYSNKDQIKATKQATPLELKLLANKRRNKTNAELYGTFHVLKTSTSKFERDAIEMLEVLGCKGHSYKTNQFYIGSSTGYFLYDYVDHDAMKIIEFNGDYWHANPKLYHADDLIGRGAAKSLAKDRWNKEAVKLEAARIRGYEVKIIWESEFKADPKNTIEECVRWLQQR